ncbi:lipoyl synthase [Candidatus Solincola sp.]
MTPRTETAEGHYRTRMPRWFHRPILVGRDLREVEGLLRDLRLNTVCRSAKCPNRMECFSRRTATFMILGGTCTRNCAFCGVPKGMPDPPDPGEPERVARAAAYLGLSHVVVTSVTRDDLPDGGAAHFAATVRMLREYLPGTTVEVLTPDFRGDDGALRTILAEHPEVLNHNLETVKELYPRVRPGADYRRSLRLLEFARERCPEVRTKSGVMVGLGETREQMRRLFRDLAAVGCDMLTIGQYLRPGRKQLEVDRFLSLEEFAELKADAEEAGIPVVASAPLVRSSYRARELMEDTEKDARNVVDRKRDQGGRKC